MKKDIIKKAFENVKPSEELVESVLSPQSVPVKEKRRFSGRRVLCTAAAVCGVLVCGVTAAAATGIIDFDALFGDYIVVKDSELANSLMGTVKNFKYKVSDDDYKIEIKGVTGSDRNVIVIAEISRVDGEPVIDHFANPVSSDEKLLECLWTERDIFMTGYSGSSSCHINEAGNIELYEKFEADGTKLSGKKIIVEGENFYPNFTYRDFKNENNVDYIKWDNYNFSGYAQMDENGGITGEHIIPADVDDSGVIALDLEWEFSFKYTASDKSAKVKSQTAPEESFTLNQNVYNIHEIHEASDIFSCAVKAVPTYIEAGSTGGIINFEYELTEYDNSADYVIDFFENNEVYIIFADGKRICGDFDGGSQKPFGNIYKCSYRIYYFDENDKRIFIDVEDIAAISINGTVYELN